jgi:hypothetical protein
MLSTTKHRFAALAATGVLALGGATAAVAASDSGGSGSSTTAQTAAGPGETALSGTTAEKVKEAALAAVDGTVIRAETDSDGVHEAHIRKPDGTEAVVQVNRDFEVTAVEECEGPGGRGDDEDAAGAAANAEQL